MIIEKELNEIINEIKEEKKDDLWIAGISFSGISGERKILLKAPSAFFKEQFLHRKYLEVIQEKIKEKTDEDISVEINV